MAKKNSSTSNAQISNLSTDNPKLLGRTLSDGTISLYLYYYDGYQYVKDKATGKKKRKAIRRTEFLKIYLYEKPRNASERSHNEEAIRVALGIKHERMEQILKCRTNDIVVVDNFYDYFKDYIDDYTKADIRHIKRALKLFQEYLAGSSKYRVYSRKLRPNQITKAMLSGFVDFLLERFEGSGPHTLWARFKKVLKHAYEDGVFDRLPYLGVNMPCGESAKKDVLSLQEIALLASTHYDGEKQRIKDAFLFSCCTGLRFCDVDALPWECVGNDNIRFQQRKVAHSSSRSFVELPLTESLLQLIGEQPTADNNSDTIFKLPTHTTCLAELRKWCKAAGINKHITWHCARHSFGTNLADNNNGIHTIMELMGHSSLKYTQRYIHAVDDKCKLAMQSISLNILNIPPSDDEQ